MFELNGRQDNQTRTNNSCPLPAGNDRQSDSGSAVHSGDIKGVVEVLQRAVDCLDPEVLEPRFAAELVETFTKVERLGAAGKALAARRVCSSGVWRAAGERSPAHWMAKKTGTSVTQAGSVLETAERMAELPRTDKAMRSGELSEAQAVQIASAAAASPSCEEELLQVAKDEGITELKQRCARVKAAAMPDELARHAAIHRQRYFRHFLDGDGAFRLDGRITPESGAVLLAAIEPVQERIMAEATEQGRREPFEAYAADALIEVAEHSRRCTADPERSTPSAMVHVTVDQAALVRGALKKGEVCEIPGVGPIPVAAARAFLSDAVVSLIGSDGADIRSVTHLGRTIPARLRTALEARDQKCVVPGCSHRKHLEIDHTTPILEGGETCLGNLSRLCHWHHYLKTYRGFRLSGGPGAWVWADGQTTYEDQQRPPPSAERSPP